MCWYTLYHAGRVLVQSHGGIAGRTKTLLGCEAVSQWLEDQVVQGSTFKGATCPPDRHAYLRCLPGLCQQVVFPGSASLSVWIGLFGSIRRSRVTWEVAVYAAPWRCLPLPPVSVSGHPRQLRGHFLCARPVDIRLIAARDSC